MRVKITLVLVALVLIVIAGIFLFLQKPYLPGKYVDKDNPSLYIILKEDGTYRTQDEVSVMLGLKWVESGGKVIVYKWWGGEKLVIGKFFIVGNTLIEDVNGKGKVWTKQQ